MATITTTDAAHRRSMMAARERFEAAAKDLLEKVAIAEEDGLEVQAWLSVNHRTNPDAPKIHSTLYDGARITMRIDAKRRII